jgi:endonuclease YncB( thermonuclease family)
MPLLAIGGGAGLALAFVLLRLAPDAAAPPPRAPDAASTTTLTANATDIIILDGATIRAKGTIIHLRGITPPERGASCVAASGASFDCGTAAANALGGLIRNQTVTCDVSAAANGQAADGLCRTGAGELNRALVISGWARAASSRSALAGDEIDAKTQRRGLWAAGNQP